MKRLAVLISMMTILLTSLQAQIGSFNKLYSDSVFSRDYRFRSLPNYSIYNALTSITAGDQNLSTPPGTTIQRPTVPSGKIILRFNTDSNALEYGNSSQIWKTLTTGSTQIFDTSSIPNFYLKVRSLFSATSPIQYNAITGNILLPPATSTQSGYISSSDWVVFNSRLPDPGSNGIVVRTASGFTASRQLVPASSNISIVNPTGVSGNPSIDINDTLLLKQVQLPYIPASLTTADSVLFLNRSTGYLEVRAFSGGGINNANVGSGYRILNSFTQTLRTLYTGFGLKIDSTLNTNGLTLIVDTSRVAIPSKYYIDSSITANLITANNGLTKTANVIQLGGLMTKSDTLDGATSYSLQLLGSGTSAPLRINQSGAGIGAFINTFSGTGSALNAQSNNATTISAFSFGSGYGASLQSVGNIGAYIATTSGVSGAAVEVNPASTNSAQTILQLKRYTSGTGANGIAGRIEFITEPNTNTVDVTSGYLESGWEDATFATRKSYMAFHTTLNGVTARKFNISSAGQLTADQYTGTNFQTIDTSYNSLVVDGSGNVFKRAGGGGGSSQTLQGVITQGATLSQANTINYAGFRQSFKSGLTILDSLSIIPAVYRADSMVYAGTSITLGIGTTFTMHYTTLTSNQLNTAQSNHGISGAQLSLQGIADTINLPVYDANKYRGFVSEWGVNDMQIGTYDSTTFSNNYKLYIDALVRKGWPLSKIRLLQNGTVCTCISGPATTARQLQFRQAISAVGTAKGVTVVDIYSLELARGGDLAFEYDGIHPNQYATPLYAALISKSFGDSVRIQNQSIASNGLNEFQNVKLRTTGTGDYRSSVLATDSAGNVVRLLSNTFIYNTLEPNIILPQPGGIYMSGQGKFSTIRTTGVSGISDSLTALYVQGTSLLNGKLTTTGDATINGIAFGHGNGNNVSNLYVGASTGGNNSGENGNTAFGNNALSLNTTGYFNTGVGYLALQNNNTGIQNVAIGVQALMAATGSGNVAIGTQAGISQTSGNNKWWNSNSSTQNLEYGDYSTGQEVINPGQSPKDSSFISSAQFQIKSTTRGFLMPRMTASQRTSISSPATGLEIYDTDSSRTATYNGSAWKMHAYTTDINFPAIYRGTLSSFTFPSISGGASTSTTVTVTGAVAGDMVLIQDAAGGALTDGEFFDARVSAGDTVTIRRSYTGIGTIASSTKTYNVMVLH